MVAAVINDLQKGYAALRDLAGSQDTSTLSALNVSNQVLQAEVKGFRKKLLGDARELPSGKHILAAEYELLCRFASLNGATEDKIISTVTMVEGARVVKLEADGLGLEDISPLAGLKALRSLDLDSNVIRELGPLAALTKLERLSIQNNLINTVQDLSGLTGLKTLYLAMNYISDLCPLSTLTALESLLLGANHISDLSPLAGIKTLKELSVDENRVSDLTVLSGLTALKELRLVDNQIKDLSALLPLGGLTELFIAGNPLSFDAKIVLDTLRERGTRCYVAEGFR